MKKKYIIALLFFAFIVLIGKQTYAEDFKMNISTSEVQVEPGTEMEIQISVENLIRK